MWKTKDLAERKNIKKNLMGPNDTIESNPYLPDARKHPLLTVRIVTKNSEEPACINTTAKFKLNMMKHPQVIVRDTTTDQEKLVTKNPDIENQLIGRRKQTLIGELEVD